MLFEDAEEKLRFYQHHQVVLLLQIQRLDFFTAYALNTAVNTFRSEPYRAYGTCVKFFYPLLPSFRADGTINPPTWVSQ
jgi:hypothetical protein